MTHITYYFTCIGCGCEVPKSYCIKTDGYCYICDPNVTPDDMLSGEHDLPEEEDK